MTDPIAGLTRRAYPSGIGGAAGLGGLDSGAKPVPVLGGKDTGGLSFGDMFKQVVSDVSASQDASADLNARFLRGEPVEVHQVMAASEEASLSLELLVEVRNKVTDAYRSLVSMQ